MDKEKASEMFLQNNETEYGIGYDTIIKDGEICKIEGIIDCAKANNLQNVAVFWQKELDKLIFTNQKQ